MIVIIISCILLIMMAVIAFIAFQAISRSRNANNTFTQQMSMFRPEVRPEMKIGSSIITQPIQPTQPQRTEQLKNNILVNIIPKETKSVPPATVPLPLVPPTTVPVPLVPPTTAPVPLVPPTTVPLPLAPPTTVPLPLVPPPAPIPETSLYPFTTHTFTNADVEGPRGPTLAQIRTAYSAIPWAERFINMNGNDGIQLWTVPKTGVYTIRAVGSCSHDRGNNFMFGLGRDIRTNITLQRGDIIRILVGQRGTEQSRRIRRFEGTWPLVTGSAGGGGGGTFVADKYFEPIIVAGGGGGWFNMGRMDINDSNRNFFLLANAQMVSRGSGENTNFNTGAGRAGTSGTVESNGGLYSGGGGGYYRDGGNNTWAGRVGTPQSTGGLAFINGGTGGNFNNSTYAHGGFGGGGAGGIYHDTVRNITHQSGGGGGGYSGGGGGGTNVNHGGMGGGGGSYSINEIVDNGATNTGPGRVIITFVR
jgi:hypothetical protein